MKNETKTVKYRKCASCGYDKNAAEMSFSPDVNGWVCRTCGENVRTTVNGKVRFSKEEVAGKIMTKAEFISLFDEK